MKQGGVKKELKRSRIEQTQRGASLRYLWADYGHTVLAPPPSLLEGDDAYLLGRNVKVRVVTEFRISDFGFRIAEQNFEFRISNFEFNGEERISNFGFRIANLTERRRRNFGFRISNCEFNGKTRISDFGRLHFGLRICNCWSR